MGKKSTSSPFQPWVVLYRNPHETTRDAPYIWTGMADDEAHAREQVEGAEPNCIIVRCVPGSECVYAVNAYIRNDSPDRNDPDMLERVRVCFADMIADYNTVAPRPRLHWTVLYRLDDDRVFQTPRTFVCEAPSEAAARGEFRRVILDAEIYYVCEGHDRIAAVEQFEPSRSTA